MRRLAIGLALTIAAGTAPALARPPAPPSYPRCVHPWPCGDEWPAGLSGPFRAEPPQRLRVPSFDGTLLGGWLFLPELPPKVKAPTVLVVSPYDGFGNGAPTGGDGDAPIAFLVEHGYAVAYFSVRGTGQSAGCFENKGPNEQRDQAHLVEWLASQPWSNRRVGMSGLSYPGTTPFQAAIRNPPHLKAIVPMGPVTDPYTEMISPQGAYYTMGPANETGRRAVVSASPLAIADDPTQLATAASQKACPEFGRVLTQANRTQFGDDRDAAYWDARRLIIGFPRITAAVFLAHGLQDAAHPFQEDPVWRQLTRAPKQAILGQWGHAPPSDGGIADWREQVLAWWDFWLKGLGRAPKSLGTVRYQDGTTRWRTTRSWPPFEARDEVLYVAPTGVASPVAVSGGRQFRAVPPPRLSNLPAASDDSAPNWPACSSDNESRVVYRSTALRKPVLIAGNPYAYLNLTSDQPGGVVAVSLYDLPGEGSCADARLLSYGVADLRFHAGNQTGRAFPVNTPTRVRVDLYNLAEVVPAGHRVVIVVGAGESASYHEANNPLADARTSHLPSGGYAPLVGVFGGNPTTASHVVLPLVSSSLGGAQPRLRYPPRPFVPRP